MISHDVYLEVAKLREMCLHSGSATGAPPVRHECNFRDPSTTIATNLPQIFFGGRFFAVLLSRLEWIDASGATPWSRARRLRASLGLVRKEVAMVTLR